MLLEGKGTVYLSTWMLLVMLLVYFKDAQTDKEFKKRQRHSGGIWEGKKRTVWGAQQADETGKSFCNNKMGSITRNL